MTAKRETKIYFSTSTYIHFGPINPHVTVSVRSCLFMMESEIVKKFMSDNASSYAGYAFTIPALNIEDMSMSTSMTQKSHGSKASWTVIDNVNVIQVQKCSSWFKLDTRRLLNIPDG